MGILVVSRPKTLKVLLSSPLLWSHTTAWAEQEEMRLPDNGTVLLQEWRQGASRHHWDFFQAPWVLRVRRKVGGCLGDKLQHTMRRILSAWSSWRIPWAKPRWWGWTVTCQTFHKGLFLAEWLHVTQFSSQMLCGDVGLSQWLSLKSGSSPDDFKECLIMIDGWWILTAN